MSQVLIRQAIITELLRAKAAWDAVPGNYPLEIDYENKNSVVLAEVTRAYLAVDIVFHPAIGGNQMDMGLSPILRMDGQILMAAGAMEGTGTLEQARVLDFFRPYLQLRDNLLNGVRTQAATETTPRRALGFYYLPMMVSFWRDAVKPATP